MITETTEQAALRIKAELLKELNCPNRLATVQTLASDDWAIEYARRLRAEWDRGRAAQDGMAVDGAMMQAGRDAYMEAQAVQGSISVEIKCMRIFSAMLAADAAMRGKGQL